MERSNYMTSREKFIALIDGLNAVLDRLLELEKRVDNLEGSKKTNE